MEINGELVNEEVRYADLGLSQALMQAVQKKGYVQATPVQGGAIPYFMEYRDVIAKAPTGTGKTFAFGIPMVEHIDPESTDVLGLVLAPTRELAIQIRDELRDLCAFKEGVRSVCLYGGQPIDKQITQLKKRPQIVVATPGRLMDHVKRRTLRLDKVETVVLDEADRMLDMGFIRDVTRILDLMPQRRNLGLFSATISREVMDISWVYQRDPVEITVRADEQNKPDITQYRLDVDRNEKVDTMVRQIGDRQGIAQGQTGQQGQQADHNTLPQPGQDQRQFGEHHGKISPRHHPPVDEAPVVVLSGDGDHREVGAEPLHTPGKQQGVGGDQKAGEQIQPEAPPPENAGGPHCFSAPVSSPCSSSCTVRISLPVFFRMSSSRMPSVMLDTRE